MHPGEQRDVQPGISAVLATDDEHTELEGAVLDLAAVLDGLVSTNFEIIVVDVSPAGRSPEALAGLRVHSPDLPLRILEGDYVGHAAALAAGFDAASYDLILVATTDGQFDVRESNHLLEAVEHGADMAIGYRARRADGVVRQFQGWGWNVLVRLVFGKTGRDVDCPVRLFRKAVWQHLGIEPRGPVPIFNAELLVRARRLGFQVVEVPITHRRPRSGAMRRPAGPSEIGRAVVELFALRRGLDRSRAENESAAGVRVRSGRQAA
jgi:glycosyltransferase involved in cell wall biosynthesis